MRDLRAALLGGGPADAKERQKNLQDLAMELLYGTEGGTAFLYTSPPIPQGSKMEKLKTPEEEAALLLAIAISELGVTPEALSSVEPLAKQYAYVLALNSQAERYAWDLGRTHPRVAAQRSTVLGVGTAHLAAGDCSDALYSLRTPALASDPPALLLQAKALLTAPHVTAAMAADAAAAAQEAVGIAAPASASGAADDAAPHAWMLARCRHVLGAALGMAAVRAPSSHDRLLLQQRALGELQAAAALEPQDWCVHYDLALQLAQMGRLAEAAPPLRAALEASRGAHADSWRLLVVVTSGGAGAGALRAARDLCAEALDVLTPAAPLVHGPMLLLKGKLELELEEHGAALASLKRVLALLPSPRPSGAVFASAAAPSAPVSALDCQARPLGAAASPAAALVELEAQACLALAQVYTALDSHADAELCVTAAQDLVPLSAPLVNALAELGTAQGKGSQHCIQLYQQALSIDAANAASHLQLGMLLASTALERAAAAAAAPSPFPNADAPDPPRPAPWSTYLVSGPEEAASAPASKGRAASADLQLARTHLTEGLAADPSCSDAWYYLALLRRQEGASKADIASCLAAALQAQETSTVIPLGKLPRMV